MSLSIIGAMLLAALLTGLGGGYKLTAMHYQHREAVAASEHAVAVEKANDNAEAAAELYEEAKAKQRVRTVTVTREVEREVKVDTVCASVKLPDGLHDALTRAGQPDQPEPDGAVPAVPAPSIGDLGGLGAKLRGSAVGAE